jgi:hypothetical protein
MPGPWLSLSSQQKQGSKNCLNKQETPRLMVRAGEIRIPGALLRSAAAAAEQQSLLFSDR